MFRTWEISENGLLVGPGSILDAHTADEKIAKRELMEGVDIYERLVRKLLA